MKRFRCQRGLGAIATIVSLLIVAFLVFSYMQNQASSVQGGTAGSPIAAVDKGRAAACLAQRHTIEREIVAWQVEHDEPPTIGALESAGFSVSRCPDGGHYSISGRNVYCSLHN